MITTNVLRRVFHIRAGHSTASAFTLEQDDKQYLITAKHVVEKLSAPYVIDIFFENRWQALPLTLTGLSPTADIAVFSPPLQMTYPMHLPADSGGAILGQDLFFLGFPFGISDAKALQENHLPMPLLKKACLSGMQPSEGNSSLFLLDGHNNPGFSGGPVVFCEQGKPPASCFKLLGVVSGYRYHPEPTYLNNAPLDIAVHANTGIIFCPDISNAVKLIQANPNGKEITKRLPEEHEKSIG